MRAAPLHEIGREAWDRAAGEAAGGWFWHTRPYADFLLELGSGRGAYDRSFAIVDESGIVAVCPVYVDEADGARYFGCGGEPVAFPAIAPQASPAQRERALAFYIEELARLAAELAVAYVRLKIPALAPLEAASALPAINPMSRLGFIDLPLATHVIDLAPPLEALWSDVRKGHRYDIRRADKICETAAWDASTITPEVFQRYQTTHHRDAGRVTRSQRSFDIMLDWIRSGNAMLLEATHCAEVAAFVLLILYRGGAYYGSGCKNPDLAQLTASHLLQWKAVEWLKAHGYSHYDLGVQFFGPQWWHVPGAKELGIARYKRGFGGRTCSLHLSERFYSAEFAEGALRERAQKLASFTSRDDG